MANGQDVKTQQWHLFVWAVKSITWWVEEHEKFQWNSNTLPSGSNILIQRPLASIGSMSTMNLYLQILKLNRDTESPVSLTKSVAFSIGAPLTGDRKCHCQLGHVQCVNSWVRVYWKAVYSTQIIMMQVHPGGSGKGPDHEPQHAWFTSDLYFVRFHIALSLHFLFWPTVRCKIEAQNGQIIVIKTEQSWYNNSFAHRCLLRNYAYIGLVLYWTE